MGQKKKRLNCATVTTAASANWMWSFSLEGPSYISWSQAREPVSLTYTSNSGWVWEALAWREGKTLSKTPPLKGRPSLGMYSAPSHYQATLLTAGRKVLGSRKTYLTKSAIASNPSCFEQMIKRSIALTKSPHHVYVFLLELCILLGVISGQENIWYCSCFSLYPVCCHFLIKKVFFM